MGEPERSGALRGLAEQGVIPLGALLLALLLFGLLMAAVGKDPLEVYSMIYRGAFASAFAWQITLTRAAPLLLTGLCVAIPAQAGLIVIGGEGALVLGGLAAAFTGAQLAGSPPLLAWLVMALAGAAIGALWIGLCGALRELRGVNETISSLLLTYIAIAVFNHLVEGPLRDPASLNKPSTSPLDAAFLLPQLGSLDIHCGLAAGVIACLVLHVALRHTTAGFALRMLGGNVRAAQLAGLPTRGLVLACCAIGGAAAGLAGMIEVAAVHGSANSALIAGYGYAGILVAFIARQRPLAMLPVAVLLGGLSASSGMLQRRLDLPDASVLVLQGLAFMAILASETLYGRLRPFRTAHA